jgi:hypothetical protein
LVLGHWKEIREDIIMATLEYLENKFEEDCKNPEYQNPDDEDKYVGIGSQYYCSMTILENFIKQMRLNTTVNMLIELCSSKFAYVNSLNYFDIGGLYAFCNKSDCDGFYSPGNSYDICKLFDLIEPFMKTKDSYECVYVKEGRGSHRIYDLFEESWKTRTCVKLC